MGITRIAGTLTINQIGKWNKQTKTVYSVISRLIRIWKRTLSFHRIDVICAISIVHI